MGRDASEPAIGSGFRVEGSGRVDEGNRGPTGNAAWGHAAYNTRAALRMFY